jgi:hypothetical protein
MIKDYLICCELFKEDSKLVKAVGDIVDKKFANTFYGPIGGKEKTYVGDRPIVTDSSGEILEVKKGLVSPISSIIGSLDLYNFQIPKEKEKDVLKEIAFHVIEIKPEEFYLHEFAQIFRGTTEYVNVYERIDLKEIIRQE